jgi:hypothetical protein
MKIIILAILFFLCSLGFSSNYSDTPPSIKENIYKYLAIRDRFVLRTACKKERELVFIKYKKEILKEIQAKSTLKFLNLTNIEELLDFYQDYFIGTARKKFPVIFCIKDLKDKCFILNSNLKKVKARLKDLAFLSQFCDPKVVCYYTITGLELTVGGTSTSPAIRNKNYSENIGITLLCSGSLSAGLIFIFELNELYKRYKLNQQKKDLQDKIVLTSEQICREFLNNKQSYLDELKQLLSLKDDVSLLMIQNLGQDLIELNGFKIFQEIFGLMFLDSETIQLLADSISAQRQR